MRHTKGKRNRIRSHHALKAVVLSKCSHCGRSVLAHIVCSNCGWYGGRQVVDVLAKLDKKERKKKEKELSRREEEMADKKGELSAAELSNK